LFQVGIVGFTEAIKIARLLLKTGPKMLNIFFSLEEEADISQEEVTEGGVSVQNANALGQTVAAERGQHNLHAYQQVVQILKITSCPRSISHLKYKCQQGEATHK
jgi:hypothetical protein